MRTNQIRGLLPILAPPFFPNGHLDRRSLRRLTEFQLSSGADGVAVFGMASEAFALTSFERAEILADVIEVVAGAIPVVAGVSASSVGPALEQASQARDGGADLLMVLPPYMVKPGQAQIVDFNGQVAQASQLRVMTQDAPGVTGVTMPLALIGVGGFGLFVLGGFASGVGRGYPLGVTRAGGRQAGPSKGAIGPRGSLDRRSHAPSRRSCVRTPRRVAAERSRACHAPLADRRCPDEA